MKEGQDQTAGICSMISIHSHRKVDIKACDTCVTDQSVHKIMFEIIL